MMSRTMLESYGSRMGAVRLACAGALLLVAVTTAAWAYDDPAPAGLTLPEDVPDGLTVDDWAVLDGNWAEWSAETGKLVEDWYYAEDTSAAAQREGLARLRIKLRTMETALADPAYRPIYRELTNLHGRLARRVDLAEAALDTLDLDVNAAASQRVADAYANLSAAVSALADSLADISGGTAWLPYVRADQLQAAAAANDQSEETVALLNSVKAKIDGRGELNAEQAEFLGGDAFLAVADAIAEVNAAMSWSVPENYHESIRSHVGELVMAVEAYEASGASSDAAKVRTVYNGIRELAVDGGAGISEVMRAHYLNYNLRIIASEGLLQRVISDTRREQSRISEPVSGAYVTGNSWTTTNVSVDLKPSDDAALLQIVVSGSVQASTAANAQQATIYGGSTGSFHGTKDVTFDGKEFVVGPARVGVNASTYASSASTNVFFLFRPIANGIAMSEAAKRKPQSDATARQRISNQVRTEMDSETGSQFENANLELESKLYGPLRELGWYPDAMQLSSTEEEMTIRARLMEPEELGAQMPSQLPAPPDKGLAIQIHESLLNNGGDRLELAGKTMTEEELKVDLEGRISKLLGREFKFTKPEGTEAATEEGADASNTFVFDAVDPIRFNVADGVVSVLLRTGLRREGQEDIPAQVIEVPLSFSVNGDQVRMERAGNVRVTPVDRPESPAVQITRANIMRANIQRAIPDREFDGTITVEREGKTLDLTIASIEAGDGWITLTAE